MTATLESPAVGTIMPDIAVTDASGTARTLHQFAEGRRSLVYFMRTASCPVCNAHVKNIERLGLADTTVVIVVPGSAADAASVAKRVGLTVVSSGDSGHAEAGLGSSMGLQHSGTFVLDADGRVLLAKTATLPTGGFAKAEVLAALA